MRTVTLCNADMRTVTMFTAKLPAAWLHTKTAAALAALYATRFAAKHGAELNLALDVEIDGAAVPRDAPLDDALDDGAVVVLVAAATTCTDATTRGDAAARGDATMDETTRIDTTTRTDATRRASAGAVLAARGRHEEALVYLDEGNARIASLEALGRLDEARDAAARVGDASAVARIEAAIGRLAALPVPPPVPRRAAPRLSTKKAAPFLREHGYAVVAGAATADDCENIVSELWDWLERLGTGVDRRDAATWTDDRWPMAAGQSGILPHHGAGHSAAMWRARRLGGVRRVFEEIWDTSDLLVSFDGPVIFRPNVSTCEHWWHVHRPSGIGPGFAVAFKTTSPRRRRDAFGLAAAAPRRVRRHQHANAAKPIEDGLRLTDFDRARRWTRIRGASQASSASRAP